VHEPDTTADWHGIALVVDWDERAMHVSLPVAAGVAEQLVSGTLVGFSSWLAI